MESTSMIKQIMDVNKKVFEDSLSAMTAFQEHAEKMLRILWTGSAFFPFESNKVVDDWATRYKSGFDDFKASVDKRFKLMECCLLNTAGQMESTMNTVAGKAGPVRPIDEATEKPVVTEKKKKEGPVKKTVKIKKATLDKGK